MNESKKVKTMKTSLWSLVTLLFLLGCSDEETNSPQPSDDVEFAATECSIYYYGADAHTGADSFDMCISDKPIDEYGATAPGSTSFLFSIYTEAKDYEYDKVELPEGTYRLDAENTYAAGTLAAERTLLGYTDDNMQDSFVYFTDATLTVTRQADGNYLLKLAATDGQGKQYHATYQGEINVLDERRESHLPSSSLQNDLEIDFTNMSAFMTYMGSQRVEGVDQWYLELLPNGNEGHSLNLVLNTVATNGMTDDGFLGTFTVDEGRYPNSLYIPGTFCPGVAYNNGLVCSWYVYMTDNTLSIGGRAALSGGDITITRDGATGTYTVDCNLEDSYGHQITGTWAGKMTLIDAQS